MKQSEFAYLGWIQKHLRYQPDVLVGSGDDAAVLRLNKHQRLLATCDMIVEGVDFKLRTATARQIGYKSLAISLSDLAAMGGVDGPIYALMSVAFKPNTPDRFAKELFIGMKSLADKFDVAIVGGDVSSTSGPLTINSTLLGSVTKLKSLLRSGARTGDAIMVTDKLGGSILGKHLSFTPRLKEALLLNQSYKINSMMDISDGLLIDLNHILSSSNKGALLYEYAIPISKSAYRLGRSNALKHALTDGEDFELLFTASPKEAERIIKDRRLKVPVTIIGQITNKQGMYIQGLDKQTRLLKPSGYEHFNRR